MIERTRIEAVLNRIRPFLQADGADIELVDVWTDCVSVSRDRPGSVQNRAAVDAHGTQRSPP